MAICHYAVVAGAFEIGRFRSLLSAGKECLRGKTPSLRRVVDGRGRDCSDAAQAAVTADRLRKFELFGKRVPQGVNNHG